MKFSLIKNITLKICCYLVFFIIYCLNKNYCYCLSNNFKFVIDTIGIPEYNVMGDRINENIYNVYNVFVYSDPIRNYAKNKFAKI